MRKHVAVAAAAAVAVLALAGAALAAPPVRPGTTVRVSLTATGAEAADNGNDLFNHRVSLTPDGRYVAFSSHAPLVADDTNARRDVFVRDLLTGQVTIVSRSTDGKQGNDASTAPVLSADGRYVAFMSLASNLVTRDRNDAWDVFVHDRQAGTTERVSVSDRNAEGYGWSRMPSISADGRYVAFDSAAETLTADDGNGQYDIFVRDRVEQTTRLVSRAPGGALSDGPSYSAAISADGQTVAFYSSARNFDTRDLNGREDVFVVELDELVPELVSVADDGARGNSLSYAPNISDDGSQVAFVSRASNLVPDDRNGSMDVFVRDRVRGTTERVSITSTGQEHDDAFPHQSSPYDDLTLPGVQPRPVISGDGRHVAFLSRAANLLPDGAGGTQLLVHDRATGTTEIASLGSGGPADAGVLSVGLDRDASAVAFVSDSSNLVDNDTNGTRDVFLRERGAPIGVTGVELARDADNVAVSGAAVFSGRTFASADPTGDTPAAAAGADLVEAEVIHRPLLGDLLVRWRPSTLPAVKGTTVGGHAAYVDAGKVPSAAAAPVAYELAFKAGSSSYVVRATAAGAELLSCATACTSVQSLEGGFGSAGVRVSASLPVSALGAAVTVHDVVARAAAPGAPAALDEVALPDVEVAVGSVALAAVPAGTPPQDTDFQDVQLDEQWRFSASLPVASGPVEVWARACLGTDCATQRLPVD